MVALPRHRRRHHKADQRHGEGDTVGDGDGQSKEEQKIKDVFKFEAPVAESLELKSFCKLLKKSCLK